METKLTKLIELQDLADLPPHLRLLAKAIAKELEPSIQSALDRRNYLLSEQNILLGTIARQLVQNTETTAAYLKRRNPSFAKSPVQSPEKTP